MTLHYGLGEINQVDSLIVTWIGQGVDRYYDLPVNIRYTAVEGEGLLNAPQEPGDPAIPSGFTLESPFPNPFNGTLNLNFTLERPGRVKVDVYDPSGRLVETLVDHRYTTGSYHCAWNAAKHTAGCYIIQAVHEGGISSRTAALVK